jgi:cysteinyl-tRNA synthetase
MSETLRIYNTQTRAKEPFETIEPGKVRMYVCGVTPYSSAHIGHGMSLLAFDVIKRYLLHKGYEVRHAQNFTDIDDKIIARANREEIDPNQLTEELIAAWHLESSALGVIPATIYPRATTEIPGIIAMIEGLIADDHAYAVDGDVYYRVRSFPSYGKLSHRNLDDLLSGARIDIDERKNDPLDFALWKAAKPGEPWWESPWGRGRPGWHIECSAMCSNHLGGLVDIHGGGADLIFPHHENEIAQSEAFLHREPFARYWVHNGMMQLSGEKMSKSLGNIVPMREIIDRGLGQAFRLMVLQSHYRAPLTYSEGSLEAAERGLDRLRVAARAKYTPLENPQGDLDELTGATELANSTFFASMDDDFDTPGAIAALFDLARAINRFKSYGHHQETIEPAREKLLELSAILGLNLTEDAAPVSDAAPFIDLLVAIRQELRSAKQWALADRIRDGLLEQGISIEDQATESTWRPA